MYDKIVLDNGLCIIGERIEHFRSVSAGVWIGARFAGRGAASPSA